MADRFYAALEGLSSTDSVELSREESHHLLKVMRSDIGDEVRVFGGGREFRGILKSANEGRAVVSLDEELHVLTPPSVRLHFLVPWLKGGKTEFIARKLTELGIASLTLFRARREVMKPAETKSDRLRKIVLEACKQCGRTDVPPVIEQADLKTALATARNSELVPIVLFEAERERSLSSVLTALAPEIDAAGKRRLPNIMLATGPEGGFAPEEIESVTGLAQFASLGPRILRADTAPLVAASVVFAISGDI